MPVVHSLDETTDVGKETGSVVTDACFAPALDLDEAPTHPHNRARGTFVDVGGSVQPAPAPRFARSRTGTPRPASAPGADTDEVLVEWGLEHDEVQRVRSCGAIA
jgi:alpha-methylacyl-CoA racemase